MPVKSPPLYWEADSFSIKILNSAKQEQMIGGENWDFVAYF
jgi:hypothetical protein